MPFTAIYSIHKLSTDTYCVSYWFTFVYGSAITPQNSISALLNGTKTSTIVINENFKNLLVNDTQIVNPCTESLQSTILNSIVSKYSIRGEFTYLLASFIISTAGSIKISHGIASILISKDKLPKLNGQYIIVEVTDYKKPVFCTVL